MSAPIEYNPFSHELQMNPFPVYRRLRDEAPVYHNPEIGFWALTRFEDVLNGHLDAATFSNKEGTSIEGLHQGLDILLTSDAPDHTWQRRIISRVFTQRRIAELEPLIRRVTAELLDAAAPSGELDVVSDFSVNLPMSVVSELLGIPVELREQVHQLSDRMLVREFADERPALPDDALVAGFEFFQLLSELVKERRQSPTGDVFSLMVTTVVDGEDGTPRSLSDDQLAARFMELAIAGHETVMKLIATGVVALAWYPDQRRELCADPSLLPNAMEEMVRWIPPSQYQGRWTTRDVELHGTTIPANQRVLLVTASATHDEREYDDPDAFDIRRRIDRQLGFGFGAHLCLGAPLARLEMRIAFEELLRRFPSYEIVESGVERAFGSNVQGLKHLPIRFPAAA